jgi:hypothetical protein
MKRLVCIGLSFALVMGMSATGDASANGRHGGHSKANRCKHGKVFRKGKCRKVKLPPALGMSSPHAIVRATMTWDGPALLGMQVTGEQGRAGYFPGEGGVVNEIPNAHYTRGTGGPGPETETLTDDVFWGDYGSVPVPNGNRPFSFGYCYQGSAGPEPSHVTYTWVTSWGLPREQTWTIDPTSPAITLCATFIN